jgi:formylmethanofuran dehydrogenase subunit C
MMSVVTFALKTDLRQRLDVSPLIPEALARLGLADIGAIPLQYGNRRLAVGEFFDVRSGPGDPVVVFRGGSEKLDYIGRGMTLGEIRVEGHAGAYLGLQMRGGSVHVTGNVGIFCAAEMRRGAVFVHGNAGDWLGGALPGNRKGMAGGSVVVRGCAGARAGDHMRRGVMLIEGDAGDYLGSRMVAGTIAIKGKVGAHPGYAMKRGTLLLYSPPGSMPPSFNDCGLHTLGFLPLLLNGFADLGSTAFGLCQRVQRYAGDLAANGKGEILVVR